MRSRDFKTKEIGIDLMMSYTYKKHMETFYFGNMKYLPDNGVANYLTTPINPTY